MELSFIELVLWSIILCFIIAVTIQAIWLLLHKEQKRPSFDRLFLGMGITAVSSSVAIVCFMLLTLPRVYIVEQDDCKTRRVINSDMPSQLSNIYIDNRTDHTLVQLAVGYGTKENINSHINIPAGEFVECENSIGFEIVVVIVSLLSLVCSEWGVKVAYNKKDLSSYKPIQIMMKYGWQQDKPRKAREFRSPYDELKHISMTMELMKECGYKF